MHCEFEERTTLLTLEWEGQEKIELGEEAGT